MDKKNSIWGNTYIKTKNGELVIRTGVKLCIGWLIFIILSACYVYHFFIKTEETLPGADNTVEMTVPGNASYKKSDNEAINTLVTSYLNATAACDQETLQALVTDPSEFDDMSVLQSMAEYRKGFENTTCYLADGYQDGEYIVVELSNMEIANVQSKPLDIAMLYVVTDADGSFKIQNGELQTGQESFVNEYLASEEIQQIYVHVRENIEYLLDTDASFKAFYDMLYSDAADTATPQDAQ